MFLILVVVIGNLDYNNKVYQNSRNEIYKEIGLTLCWNSRNCIVEQTLYKYNFLDKKYDDNNSANRLWKTEKDNNIVDSSKNDHKVDEIQKVRVCTDYLRKSCIETITADRKKDHDN